MVEKQGWMRPALSSSCLRTPLQIGTIPTMGCVPNYGGISLLSLRGQLAFVLVVEPWTSPTPPKDAGGVELVSAYVVQQDSKSFCSCRLVKLLLPRGQRSHDCLPSCAWRRWSKVLIG